MRPLLTIVAVVVLGLGRGPGGRARAAVADDQAQVVSRLVERRAALESEQQALERELSRRSAAVAELKKQRPSWNRDQKLADRLREAKDLASRLEQKAGELHALDAQLGREKKALSAVALRELGGRPPPGPARKAQLEAWRKAGLVTPSRKVEIVDVEIDPLDDPEDLDDKAATLGDSESRLRAEEAVMARRALSLRRQARLAAARERAGQDPFDDSPRRPASGANPSTAAGSEGGLSAPAISGEDQPDPRAGADENPALVYADVVDPQTVTELDRAERSGDPEQRAAAAERAVRDLHGRADRLQEKRRAMLQRARALRASGE
jgi:hypothetical protein